MQIIKKEYWDFRFFLQDGKEAIKGYLARQEIG